MISENGINHYTAIKSLSRLLRSSNTKHKCRQYFCTNYLQGFSLEASRDEHQVYRKDNEAVKVEMPRIKTLKFCDGQNQFKVPFVTYYDLDALLPHTEDHFHGAGPFQGLTGNTSHDCLRLQRFLSIYMSP